MAAADVRCCPPGSLGAAGSGEYTPTGTVWTHESRDYYVTGIGREKQEEKGSEEKAGKSLVALLMWPDVWGWNSGAIRQRADELAAEGYAVIIPRSFKTALKGGTSGDGLYPTFTFEANGAEFGPWLAVASAKPHVDAMVDASVVFATSCVGATKLGAVGVCWGAWAATVASSRHANIVVGVGWHPSVGIEAKMGGDPIKLIRRAQCPWYYMPAGNDKELEYGVDGVFTQALVEKFGKESVKTMRFQSMMHGWMARGDPTDAAVIAAQKMAMEETKSYLKAHLL